MHPDLGGPPVVLHGRKYKFPCSSWMPAVKVFWSTRSSKLSIQGKFLQEKYFQVICAVVYPVYRIDRDHWAMYHNAGNATLQRHWPYLKQARQTRGKTGWLASFKMAGSAIQVITYYMYIVLNGQHSFFGKYVVYIGRYIYLCVYQFLIILYII